MRHARLVPTSKRVLVVDDDAAMREALRIALADRGWDAEAVGSGEAALARLMDGHVDVVVLDERMPGLAGRDVLREIRRRRLGGAVLVLTAHPDLPLLRELLDIGVDGYCEKPFELEDLLARLERLVAGDDAEGAAESVGEGAEVPGVVGRSAAMARVREQVRILARAEVDGLVTGEAGVETERVARALHGLSRRSGGPFVALDCGNLDLYRWLFGQELFGGGSPAATGPRAGVFAEAERGVLFLDEVGDLPGTAQGALAVALAERAARPGEPGQGPAGVRVIAASSEDLRRAVASRWFRQDLYRRLAANTIHVPPLRDRLEDLPDLVADSLTRLAASWGRAMPVVTPDAIRTLQSYDWPGNVRELAGVVEHAAAVARGGEITAPHVRLPRASERARAWAGASPPRPPSRRPRA